MVGVEEEINVIDFYPFGCSLFVLDKRNQSRLSGTPKWDIKSRARVYLGRSPIHASNVVLVLNLSTGYISTQYHLVFDNDFLSVHYLNGMTLPPN